MDYELATGPRAQSARDRLEQRFNIGLREQAKLVESVAAQHVVDKLVAPASTVFTCEDVPRIHYGDKAATIHSNALQQMCKTLDIPPGYVKRLASGHTWEKELLVKNFNDLFQKGVYLDKRKQPTKFLHRIVGDELRGFLSRSFGRNLTSLHLLKAFVMACHEVQARPISAAVSPVQFNLKCYLPHSFEPTKGEFVAIGNCFSKSDFGRGKLRVSLSAMRISSGTTSVLEDTMKRRHVGSIIEDSDLEVSAETATKEVIAQASLIHDAVLGHLSPGSVNQILEAIRLASEEEIPWYKARAILGKLLTQKEIENVKNMLESGISDIIDLPPPKVIDGEAVVTKWWASNMISWMSTKEPDIDRAIDMQELAGSLIGAKL